jgi:hypothetical protein
LPCHPQTPRRHNAWIAPVLCIPHDQLPHPTMPEPLSLRQRKTPVNVLFRSAAVVYGLHPAESHG